MSEPEPEPILPGIHTKTAPAPAPNGMGTGLFATADIPTGEDVLRIQTPFSAVLDTPRLEDTCSGCFGKRQIERERDGGVGGGEGDGGSGELRRCTGCGVVRYCDKTCQSKDWKIAHSHECTIFKTLHPRILPNNARAIMRILLRNEHQKYKPQELRAFLKLETHIREILERNRAQGERIALSAKAVRAYSGCELKEEVVVSWFAKLDLNSFNLTNSLYDRIGLYIHPYAALINHSCDYNSVVGFDGDVLHVKALRQIKKDEQIFISYVDTTNPFKSRQKELSERYYFDCQCPKCAKGTDTREDRFLKQPQDLAAMEEVDQQARKLVESASTSVPGDAIQKLESAMNLLQKISIWPITRQPYITLRDDLITNLLSAGQFNAAFIQTSIRYLHIDPIIFPYKSHPIRQIHSWALAKLAIHISQGVEVNAEDTDIRRFELDFGLVIWSLLGGLVKGESESCTVPGFRGLVRVCFEEVHGQFVAGGIEPGTMGDRIKGEWEKVEKMVGECLGE